MELTAVFDIGKTNKKVFLFDRDLNVVHQDVVRIKEIKDDDGFASDDLSSIIDWINVTLTGFIKEGFQIDSVNFSAYGASLVHLDPHGNTATPFYNYLKSFPDGVKRLFNKEYGGMTWSRQTASPQLYMLNSGLQIYWLKHQKPEMFNNIRTILHFPQYFHYQFTGKAFSEFTSIGCHTGLWDFERKDYHQWVFAEKCDNLFPQIVPTSHTESTVFHGKKLEIGVGIHDSSAALYPYLLFNDEPFVLISTGTWSITLNPFSTEPLTDKELESDCLLYMQPDGSPVKAARLFLGNEYEVQVNKLNDFFKKDKDFHKHIKLNKGHFQKWKNEKEQVFHFESLRSDNGLTESRFRRLNSFEEAYHKLIFELVSYQVEAVKLSLGNSQIKKIYLDGGFTENEVFTKILAHELPNFEILISEVPLASALGAALVMQGAEMNAGALDRHFRLKKVI
jgi:L-fuculokinase